MAASPFHVEIDSMNADKWPHVMARFDDAALYQTWAFGAARAGAGHVSHLILKEGNEILGSCQVIIRRVPWFNVGVADVIWGPLWRKTQSHLRPDIFVQLIRELKTEYALRRRCFLRLWPHVTGEQKHFVKMALEREGFLHMPEAPAHRTLLLDLSPPIEDLRSNLLQKWRNCLNKAEKNGLNVVEGTSEELYGVFLALAGEMLDRKGFITGVDYHEYQRIQRHLPAAHKMNIMVCEAQGEPICVSIYSAIGDMGIYLLGATGQKGLGLNGAYLLQWRMIQRLKERGVRCYDLGGIDPESNPGVYKFKLGVAGKNGRDETFLGEFHGRFSARAEVARHALNGSTFLRSLRRGRYFSRFWQRRQERS